MKKSELKRRGWIKRGKPSGLNRARKAIRAVNSQRRAATFARCFHSAERVAWVRSLLCCVGTRYCEGPTENAHTVGGGAGRRAGYETIIPLCRWHHRALHHIGTKSFERDYNLDLSALAAAIDSRWKLESAA